MRTNIIERENIVTKFYSYLHIIDYLNGKTEQNSGNKNKTIIYKNKFWFHASTSGSFYIFALLLLPIMIFTDKTSTLIQRLSTSLLASAIIFGLGLFFYFILSFIPQIGSTSWFWNYILNFTLQSSIIALIFIISNRKSKI